LKRVIIMHRMVMKRLINNMGVVYIHTVALKRVVSESTVTPYRVVSKRALSCSGI